jgi:hypothetical protein
LKGESQDPEFQRVYLKLVGEESTPVMPSEWKDSSVSFCAIVTLLSKESATNVGLQDPTLQFDLRENLLIKGQSIPALHANGALNQRMRLLEIRRVARPPCFCQQSDVDVWYDDWKTPPGYSPD